jgi:hypothetical protein
MEWPLLADLPPEDVGQLLAIARTKRTLTDHYLSEEAKAARK